VSPRKHQQELELRGRRVNALDVDFDSPSFNVYGTAVENKLAGTRDASA